VNREGTSGGGREVRDGVRIETATDGPAVTCDLIDDAELLVVLVPSEAASELSTVEIRGRTVPL
jgi:hypothetical protein